MREANVNLERGTHGRFFKDSMQWLMDKLEAHGIDPAAPMVLSYDSLTHTVTARQPAPPQPDEDP